MKRKEKYKVISIFAVSSSYYREADVFFLLSFPSMFLLFNSVYWSTYLT